MSLARSTYYRHPNDEIVKERAESEESLRCVIEAVLDEWPAYGYRRVTHALRRRGMLVNHKKSTP